jgi:hypothetical protein
MQVLLTHGVDSLAALVGYLAAQFWIDVKRRTCVCIIHAAALRGLIPELQCWASRMRVNERGWPVPVQQLGGCNVLSGAASQVGPSCKSWSAVQTCLLLLLVTCLAHVQHW